MISPATQHILRKYKSSDLFPATFESRNHKYPFWRRPDFFRRSRTSDFFHIRFTGAGIEVPFGAATPQGKINMQLVHRPVRLLSPDRVLYHYNAQKLFALFLQFDTLMTFQVQAFAGMRQDDMLTALYTLWNAGVIERSHDGWLLQERLGHVWRLSRKQGVIQNYQKGMDPLLRMFATGPYELDNMDMPFFPTSPMTVRHNLIAAETMLRLAETVDNACGIWGDAFTAASMLYEPGFDGKRRMSRADMALTTKNGSIVLFEMVGGKANSRETMKKISQKVGSWMGVIASSSLDISVIFVDANHSMNGRAMVNAIQTGILEDSREYVTNDHARYMAAEKVGVASATMWFPDDGTVSRGATRLAAFCPSLKAYKCFDVPDPRYSSVPERAAVIANSVTALHTPNWMRNDFVEKDPSKFYDTDVLRGFR